MTVNDIQQTIMLSDIPSDLPSIEDSVKWILANAPKIDGKCNDVFEYFFKVNEIKLNEMPDYTVIPYACEIERNYRCRYLIVKNNEGDLFLVCLKLNDPPGHQRAFMLSYRILPYMIGVDTSGVYEAMKNLHIHMQVVVSDENPYMLNYYNTSESSLKFISAKWKQKHRINNAKILESV